MIENEGVMPGWRRMMRGLRTTTVSRGTHIRTRIVATGISRTEEGGLLMIALAFKRPAPAVWGNGLWGSVGGAGRSYD